MSLYKIAGILIICFFATLLSAKSHTVSMPDGDLSLYYGWQERETRDSAYLKAYQRYQAEKARGITGGMANSNNAVRQSSLSKTKSKAVLELEALSAEFGQAFWADKDYDRAFYIGFEMEEMLPQVTESEYPARRRDYFKLGEAYYLFLDNIRSIELLEKALSPAPTSFTDQINLDALNILGICYANIGNMELSDDYFRATLTSHDVVLHRPTYNAYALSHLGCNAMLVGQYDKALALSVAIWPTLRKTNDYGHLAGMCYCRGRSYLQKGDFKQASAWVDSLVYFAHKDQYNQTKRIKQAYNLKADYYTAMGDARQAKIYNDSLINVYKTADRNNTSQYIARAAQQYNNDKIDTQLKKLKTSRIRSVVWAVVALCSIAVAFVVTSLYRRRNAAYKVLAQKAVEWARLNEETTLTPNKIISSQESATDEDTRIMLLIEHEMVENYAYRKAELTSEVLADRLGIHRNSISHAVNRITGGNFKNYINGYRIKEAVRIISESGRSQLYIEQIYEQVGFGNRNSFYRAFKQFTGLSPAEFQKTKDSPSH